MRLRRFSIKNRDRLHDWRHQGTEDAFDESGRNWPRNLMRCALCGEQRKISTLIDLSTRPARYVPLETDTVWGGCLRYAFTARYRSGDIVTRPLETPFGDHREILTVIGYKRDGLEIINPSGFAVVPLDSITPWR